MRPLLRPLLLPLLLAGCGSASDPAPAPAPAPAAAAPAAAPVELRGQTHLEQLLSRHQVSMVGTLDRRVTLAWGGQHDALALDDGRVVALRLPRLDERPELRSASEAAQRAAADALLGQRVAVVGDLHVPMGGEFSLSSVPAREGGSIQDPMVPVAVTLRPNQLLAAADAPDFGIPDATEAFALSQVLRSVDLQAHGTLRVTEDAAGHPGFLLELQDSTPLELRVVVESGDAARALDGAPVVVDGRLALAEDGEVRFTRDGQPVTREPTLALEAKQVRPAG